jgi:hypothetical protein
MAGIQNHLVPWPQRRSLAVHSYADATIAETQEKKLKKQTKK